VAYDQSSCDHLADSYGHFFLISSLFNKTYISILIFFSPSRKEREAGKWHLYSTKNGKNHCRDARAVPSVSFRCRLASKQASARRNRKETAFVPQACTTAWKTEKTADAAIFTQPT
jgi:hypothetical protein